MPKSFYSYKTIPEDSIQLTWYIYDSLLPKDGVIKRWKKNMDLNISLRLFINNNAVVNTVDEGCSVSFYICYHSLNKLGGTSLHGLAKKIPFRQNGEPTQDISIEDITISGEEIAGSTEVTFYAVLESPSAESEINVFAKEKGAILYEQSILLHLEGNQALFPVKAIDFSESDEVKGKNALYFLKRRFSQLDSNFNSAYCLYFNKSHILFSKINSDNEKDLAASYLLKMIMFDVYKTIVEDALDKDSGLTEIQNSSEEVFTLRAVYSRIVQDLISYYFPEKDLEGMKNLLTTDESSRNALYTVIQDYIIGE